MEREVTYSGIIGRTLGLVADDWLTVLGLIALFTGVATWVDLNVQGISNALNIPVLVVQYYVIRRLVDRHGLRSAESHGGFGSFFVLGLVSGIAILLASILFIVPGIYLSARWAMSDAALLAENGSWSEAMSRSSAATKGRVLPVALALITLTLPSLLLLALTVLPLAWPGVVPDIGLNQTLSVGVSIAINLCAYVPQVIGWYFGVALYAIFIGRPGDQLSQVFA